MVYVYIYVQWNVSNPYIFVERDMSLFSCNSEVFRCVICVSSLYNMYISIQYGVICTCTYTSK